MLGQLGLKRGDVVRVAEGKPRPAVVVQSDLVPTPEQLLLCPFTTTLLDASLYRLPIDPSTSNGLRVTSQLMVDQVAPSRRSRIDGVIGRLTAEDMDRLDSALRFILSLDVQAL